MSETIIAVPLDPVLSPLHAVGSPPFPVAPLLRDFNCGDEPFEQELARWIQQEAEEALGRGTCVWLYVTDSKEIIGYGSLAMTRWHYPESAKKRATLAIIPPVAIQKQFWGKPDGPRKIVTHRRFSITFLWKQRSLRIDIPILGLFVHPENKRAIKAYERAGFTLFSKTYHDKATGITYLSMIRPITLSAE